MVQFDRCVERHQMGCSSTPGESRECSTSTQRERAPRVPMRLARGKRRPASIAVRQATSRVTVTAEQGHQHLSSAGQTEFANDCLMTFCEVTCVERGGWLVAVRNFPRCWQLESRCWQPPARRPTDPLRGRKSLKTGGRSGHAPPYQLGSTSRARAHGKPKFWFSAVPPDNEEAQNESAVCELVM